MKPIGERCGMGTNEWTCAMAQLGCKVEVLERPPQPTEIRVRMPKEALTEEELGHIFDLIACGPEDYGEITRTQSRSQHK